MNAVAYQSIKLRITLPFNPSMPHEQYLYVVSCMLNTEKARARDWLLLAAVTGRQTVDFPIAVTTSIDRRMFFFMTKNRPLAERIQGETAVILEEAGVGAEDVTLSPPVRQCDHEPHQKPNINGEFRCRRCEQFLGKLSWPS